jgi:hypothetical protein
MVAAERVLSLLLPAVKTGGHISKWRKIESKTCLKDKWRHEAATFDVLLTFCGPH